MPAAKATGSAKKSPPRTTAALPANARARTVVASTARSRPSVAATLPTGETLTVAELRHLIKTFYGTVKINMTPEIRKELLKRNDGNRKLSIQRAERFAKDMASDRWMDTGEPLIVSAEGILNTGQHRLTAIDIWGGEIALDVRFGVPRAAFQVTDTGRPHNSSDVLAIMGVKYYAVTAAVIRLLLAYEEGLPSAANRAFTNDAIADGYRRWPDVTESIALFNQTVTNSSFRFSALVATGYMGVRTAGVAKTEEFLRLSSSGLTSKASHPCRRLYDRILRDKSEKARTLQIERFAVCIKAFNAWQTDTDVQNLRWRSGGPAAEPFPTMDGLKL